MVFLALCTISKHTLHTRHKKTLEEHSANAHMKHDSNMSLNSSQTESGKHARKSNEFHIAIMLMVEDDGLLVARHYGLKPCENKTSDCRLERIRSSKLTFQHATLRISISS